MFSFNLMHDAEYQQAKGNRLNLNTVNMVKLLAKYEDVLFSRTELIRNIILILLMGSGCLSDPKKAKQFTVSVKQMIKFKAVLFNIFVCNL